MQRSAVAIGIAIAIGAAGCGATPPDPFTVDPACHAPGTAIVISGLDDGDRRTLFYGLQGGQHVLPRIVVRGVDPQGTRVRVQLVREIDDAVTADQVFGRFVPGADPCDVALPDAELFVSSTLTDGMTVRAEIVVTDGARVETREASGVCVAGGDGTCGPHPLLVLRQGDRALAPGDAVVPDADGTVTLAVDAPASPALLWGAVAGAALAAAPIAPIAIDPDGATTIDVALVLSLDAPLDGGVIASFVGTLRVVPAI